MSWIIFVLVFEMGFLPRGYIETYYSDIPEVNNVAWSNYIDFEAEVQLFEYFFIGGESKVYVNKPHMSNDFYPMNTEWGFSLGARISILEIGFRHYCTHPIVPWIYHNEISPQWEGVYEEIYLRIEVIK